MEIMEKKKAFTLAEVLITLSIIGVVAALTIPTLVTNYKSKALETQSNKAKATLANGFKLMMANDDVGSIEDTTFASCTTKECFSEELGKVFTIAADYSANSGISGNLIDGHDLIDRRDGTKGKSLAPIIITRESFNTEYKFPESRPSTVWTDSVFNYVFETSDGMIIGIERRDILGGGVDVIVTADVNGVKKPNKGTEDLRRYIVRNNGTLLDRSSDVVAWGGSDVAKEEAKEEAKLDISDEYVEKVK